MQGYKGQSVRKISEEQQTQISILLIRSFIYFCSDKTLRSKSLVLIVLHKGITARHAVMTFTELISDLNLLLPVPRASIPHGKFS